MIKAGIPGVPMRVPRTGGGRENGRQGLGDLGVSARRGFVAVSLHSTPAPRLLPSYGIPIPGFMNVIVGEEKEM